MENEIENTDSSNGDNDIEVTTEDITALKEKLTDLEGKNRQLFERAKKAEGFELKDGDWIKPEPKEKPKAKPVKSDDKLVERLDKMSLQVAGIKEADEIELFNKWKEDTGREADDIVGNNIFKKELEELRTAKANQEATSNIKGEKGVSSGAKDNPDYWIAKATKGDDGQLRFPEETPKELYSKILDKISKDEPGASENLRFYND